MYPRSLLLSLSAATLCHAWGSNPWASSSTSSYYAQPTAYSQSAIYVQVGQNGNLTYEPNNVKAKKGQKIIFKFNPKNHTVTQSSLGDPCTKLEISSHGYDKGFDSGFNPVSPNASSTAYPPEFTVEVKDDKTPIWVYCRQRINATATHCGSGMVFAANAPENTFQEFLQRAKSSDASSNTSSSAYPQGDTIYVEVGLNGTLTYEPNNVKAKKGDKIVFKFNPKNHTVTQSSLGDPCTKLEISSHGYDKGFDSGFNPVSPNASSTAYRPEFTVEVKDDKTPIWVYCRQRINATATHCGSGMVFAANAPENTFQEFLQRAKSSDASSNTSSSANPQSTIYVEVGSNGNFAYEPNNIKATNGTTVVFKFNPKNHTVTQSSFNDPCVKLETSSHGYEKGFDSGFMPVNDTSGNVTFNITIENDSKPIWAYCRQTGHCNAGMVLGINAPDHGPRTFEAFSQLAKHSNSTTLSAAYATSTAKPTSSG